MNNTPIVTAQEHEHFLAKDQDIDEQSKKKLNKLDLQGAPRRTEDEQLRARKLEKENEQSRKDLKEIQHLYLRRTADGEYQTDYYVGLDWLKEHELALYVKPKRLDIDYVCMYIACCQHPEASRRIGNIFHIHESKPFIPIEQERINDITLFIMIRFLAILYDIVRRGLKRGFVHVEENIHTIKGKLRIATHLKRNVATCRPTYHFCRYQEHSVNCIENRILKRALCFVERYMHNALHDLKPLFNRVSQCRHAFAAVDENIATTHVKHYRVNPLYREYAQALKLAKMILKQFDYALVPPKSTSEPMPMPPYIINMPLLFELYALTQFDDRYAAGIRYQPLKGRDQPDFLCCMPNEERCYIIDTKYKYKYGHNTDPSDIGQLSRYARSERVLKALKVPTAKQETTVIPCIIIYPEEDGAKTDGTRKISLCLEQIEQTEKNKISGYTKFYKTGIKLPHKEPSFDY